MTHGRTGEFSLLKNVNIKDICVAGEFKFVINKLYWVEAPDYVTNRKTIGNNAYNMFLTTKKSG